MTRPADTTGREVLAAALGATPECVPVARFDALTAVAAGIDGAGRTAEAEVRDRETVAT